MNLASRMVINTVINSPQHLHDHSGDPIFRLVAGCKELQAEEAAVTGTLTCDGLMD